MVKTSEIVNDINTVNVSKCLSKTDKIEISTTEYTRPNLDIAVFKKNQKSSKPPALDGLTQIL